MQKRKKKQDRLSFFCNMQQHPIELIIFAYRFLSRSSMTERRVPNLCSYLCVCILLKCFFCFVSYLSERRGGDYTPIIMKFHNFFFFFPT